MSPILIILSAFIVVLSLFMLVAKNPISAAMSLLGILIMTAGIYGIIGEHLIATIQLVVYAGAIMVLFIFSIMLLNLNTSELEFKANKLMFIGAVVLGTVVFAAISYGINAHFLSHTSAIVKGPFSLETINNLGGNTKVLAHSLFSQFYVSFEVISLALLVAVVAAVVLAKRKFD
jgi:NADH-quinone oxidoreductase subunit J